MPIRDLADRLHSQLMLAGIRPLPTREFRFHPMRRYRFDMAWPDKRLAVEVDGGIWKGKYGRHTSPKGFVSDCDKTNLAQLLGWTVLRIPGPDVKSGHALNLIEHALKNTIPEYYEHGRTK